MQLGVGRLTGVFGIRGELKCKPTPLGEDAFAAGRTFAYRSPGASGELRCTGARRHHERLLLSFEGIGDPEGARAYVGAELFAERAQVELGPGEYLDTDLIGLRLIDEEGRELAQVVGVEHFPAQELSRGRTAARARAARESVRPPRGSRCRNDRYVVARGVARVAGRAPSQNRSRHAPSPRRWPARASRAYRRCPKLVAGS